MGRRRHKLLPGFGLTLGVSVLWVSLLSLLPICALALKTGNLSGREFLDHILDPRALATYRLTLRCALAATLVNTFLGLHTAWILARYNFPGRKILDALVDLPFALPTAVAGLALATLTSPSGWIGSLLEPLGLPIAYTPAGIALAMTFTSFPFVVRTVQPVLEDLDTASVEAARSLGAPTLYSFFHVILPEIYPALLAGASLSFVRSIGEFGAIVFISGNHPYVTEVSTMLVFIRLAEYDYNGAAAIAVVMLAFALTVLLLSNLAQTRLHKERE